MLRPDFEILTSIPGIFKNSITTSVWVEERNELFFSINSEREPLHVVCTKSFGRESLLAYLTISIKDLRLFQNKLFLLILTNTGKMFVLRVESREIFLKCELTRSDRDYFKFSNVVSQSLICSGNNKKLPIIFDLKTLKPTEIQCPIFRIENSHSHILPSNFQIILVIVGRFADLHCAISIRKNFKFKYLKTPTPNCVMLNTQSLRKDDKMLYTGSDYSNVTITDTRSWKVLKSLKHSANKRIYKLKCHHGLVYGSTYSDFFVFRDSFPFELLCHQNMGAWISEINMSRHLVFFGTGVSGDSYFLKNVFLESKENKSK